MTEGLPRVRREIRIQGQDRDQMRREIDQLKRQIDELRQRLDEDQGSERGE
jgi:phage shock protein A